MIINKTNLQTALEIVKPGLASKELIDQSTSFAFMGDRVVTYNDDISVSHPIEGLNITGAVKADKLYALLNKLKQEEIEVEICGGEILLKSGTCFITSHNASLIYNILCVCRPELWRALLQCCVQLLAANKNAAAATAGGDDDDDDDERTALVGGEGS